MTITCVSVLLFVTDLGGIHVKIDCLHFFSVIGVKSLVW